MPAQYFNIIHPVTKRSRDLSMQTPREQHVATPIDSDEYPLLNKIDTHASKVCYTHSDTDREDPNNLDTVTPQTILYCFGQTDRDKKSSHR